MNQKLLSGLLVLVLCLTMLTGCSAGGAVDTTPGNTVNVSEETDAFQFSTEPVEDTTAPPIDPYSATMSFGLADEPLRDGTSFYREYAGGELTLPVLLDCTGYIQQVGVGLLLFLDGQVQPYRAAGSDTYEYLHIFYPSDTEKVFPVTFVPVTGSQGDSPDLYMVGMLAPDYLSSQGPATSMTHTAGPGVYRTPLRFLADPPKAEFPSPTVRLNTQKITQTDCAYQDIAEWTDEDWKAKVQSTFIINEAKPLDPIILYGITPEVPARLHYEIWGAEAEENNLVVFVDNVPVYGPDGKPLELHLETGKKTVVDMELDMTGFAGESVVYAIRVPTNYIASGTGPSGDLKPEQVWFLLAGEKPIA